MQFFCRDMEVELERTVIDLARFLQTKPDRLVLLDNATVAMNIVAETVPLQEGDEILLTDHEYGAVRNIWSRRCELTGATLKFAALPFPPRPEGWCAGDRKGDYTADENHHHQSCHFRHGLHSADSEVCAIAKKHNIMLLLMVRMRWQCWILISKRSAAISIVRAVTSGCRRPWAAVFCGYIHGIRSLCGVRSSAGREHRRKTGFLEETEFNGWERETLQPCFRFQRPSASSPGIDSNCFESMLTSL